MDHLPLDVIRLLVGQLRFEDLAACCRVCKAWNGCLEGMWEFATQHRFGVYATRSSARRLLGFAVEQRANLPLTGSGRYHDAHLRNCLKKDPLGAFCLYGLTLNLRPRVLCRLSELSSVHAASFPWKRVLGERLFTAVSLLWEPVFETDVDGWEPLRKMLMDPKQLVQVYALLDDAGVWWLCYIIRLADRGRYFLFGREPETDLRPIDIVYDVSDELRALYAAHNGLEIFRACDLKDRKSLWYDSEGIQGDHLVAPVAQVAGEWNLRQKDGPRRTGWSDPDFLILRQTNGHQDMYGLHQQLGCVHFDHEQVNEYNLIRSLGSFIVEHINWCNTAEPDYY